MEQKNFIKELCRGRLPAVDSLRGFESGESSPAFSQFFEENGEAVSLKKTLEILRAAASSAERCRLYRDLGRRSLVETAEILCHHTACDLLLSCGASCGEERPIALALTEDALASEWTLLGASLREENGELFLDGEKKRVLGARKAEAFLVLAFEGPKKELSLFCAPSNLPGLEISKEESGEVYRLRFDRARITEANRVGERGGARRILIPFETQARLDWAAACWGASRRCFDQILCAGARNTRLAKPLAEARDIKKAIGRAAVRIKTLESALLLTASLKDAGNDINLEAAVVKVLASRIFREAGALFELLGGEDLLEAESWPRWGEEEVLSGTLFGSELALSEVVILSAVHEEVKTKRSLPSLAKAFSFSRPRIKGLPSNLSAAERRVSEMIPILGHVAEKLVKVYGENFVNEQAQHERLFGMIEEVFSCVALLLALQSPDEKEQLTASEVIEMAWEDFVKRSGELYTTKHDDELISLAEDLLLREE